MNAGEKGFYKECKHEDCIVIYNRLRKQCPYCAAIETVNRYRILLKQNFVESEMSLKEIEENIILNALSSCDGNRELAAKLLKIPERTFYRKLGKIQRKNEIAKPLN